MYIKHIDLTFTYGDFTKQTPVFSFVENLSMTIWYDLCFCMTANPFSLHNFINMFSNIP